MARGILAIFNNVAPGRDADFDNWFQGEHLDERLSVPGFLYGRRHKAISGAAAYFNFYVTENPAVLTSQAYLDRVNNPTPRTRVTMSEIFRDMNRTVCRRDLRLRNSRGAFAVTARFGTPQDTAALRSVLDDFAKDETVCGEIWVSAEMPGMASEEEKLRGGDRKIAACLMIDTLYLEQAEKIGQSVARSFPAADVGVFRVLAHMGNSSA
ncbi:MAG: hypothetical protein JO205_01165 [Pseudolabrys sp.]|nr:hypothetical protein [Pseudolabrys sp.]